MRFRMLLPAVLSTAALLAAGCAVDPASSDSGQTRLKLGYFPNLTHATAIYGVAEGSYADALGPTVAFDTALFNAGPEAVEALFSGAIDATFIGPSPTINAYAVSQGEAVRVIAGATSGGAYLVVAPEITGADDLRGATLASPQLGNTQDIALRAWLAEQGLHTDQRGGGDVTVQPQGNAQILDAFRAGAIAGAWVPEPWASRLVLEEGAKVLVDEASLWPDGRYTTTHLVVRSEYLAQHPDEVTRLLAGHVAATRAITDQPQAAKASVNQALAQITGKALPAEVLDAAWANLEFTIDPLAASLRRYAQEAVGLGLIKELPQAVKLDGLYALQPLNAVLSKLGQPPVEGL